MRCRWPPESCARPAVEQMIDLERARRHRRPCASRSRRRHFADAQRVGDVLGDRHVRVERVALEHHGDVAVARLQTGDVALADEHPAGGRRLEAGKNAQRRRLAAA